mmetsp:Transcript_4480/g.12207  ORF Transcript_4480/g.12207 Transcript_4480/m.12207 type:complete len:674 (+) Transcript_4480:138-2159(+)|eukprot:CAMPEP_0202353016 /NCGR_PEP_ID=MMETSP1126-20121109/8963_1 /ASSEMBLY_ACC=CAM_ASM_000457 /TAXON_ID=3047 /ORGANISM="Dunaliella tertiolecta, Strain CCMP1320" /LENGTH=673 /DNA_ID=CAMNT_0048945315 /DNA_START=77 /DNA_END=2098 /DNA_ORIENTATION=+
MGGFNIRQKQADVLVRVINLNSPLAPGKDPGDLYKVLVLDRFTKDIVAPLLRLNDLRRNGVTLHLMLEAERQPIPDVPAVYLVQPSQANAERIIADAAAGLYEAMHLNFTSSLPSRTLESIAAGTVRAGAAHRIAKLYDQYLAFIALEPSLFSLGQPNCYVELNDPSAKDTQIEAAVGHIVDGLFSVCVTLGVVPIIRCPRGGAAEHVAGLLDQKLRDSLKARNNLFAEGVLGLAASLSRPLLCLFDRNFDLGSALQHVWTYKPLVHDVLGMKLNRIVLSANEPSPAGGAGGKQAPRSYEVDDRDFFWEGCGAYPFPKVAEEVETQLQKYRASVEDINKHSAAGAREGVYVDPDELIRRNTHNLMAAVSSLPELQEQKRTLDKHTNLATALLAAIKARGLDGWHNGCEDVLCGKSDLGGVLKLVGGTRGTPADRLRLAVIWLLAYDGLPSDSDMGELESALKRGGADITALTYVRTLKRNNLIGTQKGSHDALAGLAGNQPTGQAALFDWADKTLGQGLSHVTKSVKTLLSGARQPPLVGAVEALAEGRAGSPEFESYAVFDPKAPPGRAGLDRAKGPFKECIVFMIGAGSYAERESLMTWAARSGAPAAGVPGALGGVGGVGGGPGPGGRHLIYGATDILQGQELLAQLAELGRRCGVGPGGVELAPQAPAT